MKIGIKLLKELNKKFAPSSLVPIKFGRYDVAVKTDEEGNPILVFIGKANFEGIIKGNRFSRVLIKNPDGTILKDHWDHKGKT